MHVNITVNGRSEYVSIESNWTLVDLLRRGLGLLGTEEGCGEGVCGSCTVKVNGALVRSCLVLAARVTGAAIETIEAVGASFRGASLQRSFVVGGAIQCGFCTPGMIMTALELLDERALSEERIRKHLSGNICRCGGYPQIVRCVRNAWSEVHGEA